MNILHIEQMAEYNSDIPSIVEQYSTCLLDTCNTSGRYSSFHTSGRYPFIPLPYVCKIVKEMSQIQENEFKLRRAHWEGKGGIACCLNIPKSFWQRMQIDKQSYLKVTYSENKLIVEKLVDGGHIDNK